MLYNITLFIAHIIFDENSFLTVPPFKKTLKKINRSTIIYFQIIFMITG